MSGLRKITANNVEYDNTTSGLTGDDVQEAIDEISQRLGGGTLSPLPIYLTTDTSAIVGTYKQLSYALPASQTILTTVVNNNEVLINTYLFDLPYGDTILPAGEWIMEIYGYVSQTTLLTKYKVVVFKRSSGGVDTDLFTMNSADINNTTLGEITFESYQPEYTVAATDYIGIKLYANTTASTNITVYTYLGDGYPSYITTPLPMRHDLLRGLKYTTSNETGYSHLSNGADTIYGVKTFNSFPITPSSAPTTDYQVANKKYVDDNASSLIIENAQTASYTLVLTDANKLVSINLGGPTTLTIPTNANVAFPVGTVISLVELGTGAVTVAGDTGVTVNSNGGLLSLNGQYAAATLIKRATNTWLLVGNLA